MRYRQLHKTGKGSTGQTLNVDMTIARLNEAIEELKEADEYIKSLSDSEFKNLKDVWTLLYNESIKLNDRVQAKKPDPEDDSYDFDTGLFSQYMYAFMEEISEVEVEVE